MIRYLTIVALALLGACGGSQEDDLSRSHGLEMQAEAYVNAMPTIVFPDQPYSCTTLIIVYSVVAKLAPLPTPASVASVSVKKKGQVVWTGTASFSESGQKGDASLYGIVRGCPPAGLAEGDLLEIVLRIESGMESGDASAQAVLYYAN